MRKLLFLSLICVLTFSCSSDDDGGTPEVDFDYEAMLVNNSPWLFDEAEVIEVTANVDPPASNSEIKDLADQQFLGLSFTFAENGTGSFTTPNGESYSFNYSHDMVESTLTLEGAGFGTLENVSITEDELKFNSEQVVQYGNTGMEEIVFWGRFTMK